ncbi:MAG: mycofactocin biosynthesis chaperone MftB [Actinobacteria bacterium]|nr:mycofactocin biosynthesis chaperone MftB [Actinomycetota bacterium]
MLSPSVSLRPEPFGALAYHFGNRRLTFLKRPELVEVVSALDGRRTVREVLEGCGIPEGQWSAYDATIERLRGADMLQVATLAAVSG